MNMHIPFVGFEKRSACEDGLSMSVRMRFRNTIRYACPFFVVVAVAAAAVFLRTPVRRWYGDYTYDHQVGIRDVIRAAGNLTYRRSAPRLAGGFPYRPIEPVRVLRGSEDATEDLSRGRVYAAVGPSLPGPRNPRSSSYLHAVGVAQLVAGDVENALTTLEQATMAEARQPSIAAAITRVEDAALLSDLAAASFAAGQRDGRSELILRTIELTSRALAIDPGLAAAAFNRALAIESILTRGQAGEAWTAYVRLDADSGWAYEARDHIRKLSSDTGLAKRAHSTEASATSIEENLLPAWGDAFQRGNMSAAHAAFDEAASMAESLRACCADEFHEAGSILVECRPNHENLQSKAAVVEHRHIRRT